MEPLACEDCTPNHEYTVLFFFKAKIQQSQVKRASCLVQVDTQEQNGEDVFVNAALINNGKLELGYNSQVEHVLSGCQLWGHLAIEIQKKKNFKGVSSV